MRHGFTIITSAICLTVLLSIGAAVMAPATASGNPAVAANTTPRVHAAPEAKFSPKVQATAATVSPSAVFAGGMFVNSSSAANQEVARLTAMGATGSAALVTQISSQPTAIWIGDWFTTAQLAKVLATDLAAARKTGATPTFVTYAIPGRDCGGYSAGGLTDSTYLAWNAAVALDLQGSHSVVIVEPDAVAMLATPACANYLSTRPALLTSAVDTLVGAGLTVYLDAGNSHWIAPAKIASLLLSSGIADARGFSTNVANFNSTAEESANAEQLSALVGGAHYVIDTSRNGANRSLVAGWCNPPTAGLGRNPAIADGSTKLDALLWVKPPGASDGTCNGGPAAGHWWLSGALALVTHRGA